MQQNYNQIRAAHWELMRIRESTDYIEHLRGRVRRLYDDLLAVGITSYGKLGVKSSPNGDVIGEKFSKIDEIYSQIVEKILCQQKVVDELTARINTVPYPECEVLRRYYIDFQNLELISVNMNYDYRHISRLKNNGLLMYFERNREN